MRARDVLRDLLPPLLVNFVARRRVSTQNHYIWNGVYKDFQQVPARGAGHATDARLEAMERSTRCALDKVQENGLRVGSEYALSPLIVSYLNNSESSILDIGGGTGLSYLHLRASIPNLKTVHYEIVEVERIAKLGRKLFADDKAISFLSEMPGEESIGKFDLVQFCGSLQYFDDYKAVIKRACEYRPRFIYLLKTPIGNFPTFATAQYNLPDAVAPVWFFNRQTLVQLFEDAGYELMYKGSHDRVYDTSNFDPAYQMKRYSHLLFARNEIDSAGNNDV